MGTARHEQDVAGSGLNRHGVLATRARINVVGRGPVRVVATHGWTTGREGYDPLVEHIDQSQFTFAFVDARGYGAARQEAGAFTMAEVGADLLSIAAELGWDRFSLMGHSMGGLAIQHALVLAPDRVKSIVGIAPVPAGGGPLPDDVLALFRSAVDSIDSRRLIFDISTGQRCEARWLDEQAAASMAATDPTACRSYLDSWTTTDISAEVAGMEVPVLVVVGEHDPGITKESSEQAWGGLYPNLTVSVAPGAGHYPTIETPKALVTTVEAFLSKHG